MWLKKTIYLKSRRLFGGEHYLDMTFAGTIWAKFLCCEHNQTSVKLLSWQMLKWSKYNVETPRALEEPFCKGMVMWCNIAWRELILFWWPVNLIHSRRCSPDFLHNHSFCRRHMEGVVFCQPFMRTQSFVLRWWYGISWAAWQVHTIFAVFVWLVSQPANSNVLLY